MSVQLSVIVTVLDSHEALRRQLLYLGQILTPECELIVVDDGSSPPLEETWHRVAKPWPHRLLVTDDQRPWTQPRARNLGAAIAEAERLLFFDIDHILTRQIIDNALHFEGDKMHWWRLPGELDPLGRLLPDQRTSAPGQASIHVNSFLIRRSLFNELGGYDERFCGRYGGDDIDFDQRYQRLVAMNRARPAAVAGQGYVFPDPARNAHGLFHHLPRNVPAVQLNT